MAFGSMFFYIKQTFKCLVYFVFQQKTIAFQFPGYQICVIYGHSKSIASIAFSDWYIRI